REGLVVSRVAKNRLLLNVTGTVGAFNATFDTELHLFSKIDDATFQTFGHHKALVATRALADQTDSVVVADPPADTSPLPGETGSIVNDPHDQSRLTLAAVAR